jgi:RND family efflux transporter, MFP subunit
LKHRTNIGKVNLLLFICIFSWTFTGCGLLPREEQELEPPLIKPKQAEYELYEVSRKDITKLITGNGSLIPVNEAALSFKQSGRIASINVQYGENIKKGTLTAVLDTGDLASRIKIQELTLEKAKLRLAQLESQGSDVYSVGMAKIDVESAQVSLDSLKNTFEQSKLISPIGGMITFIENLKVGSSIEAYKPIVTVSDPGKLQILYQATVTPQVKTGMEAQVTYRNTKYDGVVVLSPDNVPSDATDKYKNAVIIQVKNLPSDAKLGDFADFSVPIESRKNTIVIPKNGLRRMGGSDTVQIMEGDSKKELNVEVGIETSTEVEILSGLKEGQKVILK